MREKPSCFQQQLLSCMFLYVTLSKEMDFQKYPDISDQVCTSLIMSVGEGVGKLTSSILNREDKKERYTTRTKRIPLKRKCLSVY